MFKESAQDGFDKEFEDVVDLMGFMISPLIKKADKWDEWETIEKHGSEIPITDTVKTNRAKRQRIRDKMILVMEILNDNKLLLKSIGSHKWDFDPSKYEG